MGSNSYYQRFPGERGSKYSSAQAITTGDAWYECPPDELPYGIKTRFQPWKNEGDGDDKAIVNVGFLCGPRSAICHEECLNCDGLLSTDCLSCKANAHLQGDHAQPLPDGSGTSCVCDENWNEAGSTPGNCLPKCHARCATCDGITISDCNTCFDNAGVSAGGQCVCNSGFKMVNDECIDINECASVVLNLCSATTAVCENTDGSYLCNCRSGFEPVAGQEIVRKCQEVSNAFVVVEYNKGFVFSAESVYSATKIRDWTVQLHLLNPSRTVSTVLRNYEFGGENDAGETLVTRSNTVWRIGQDVTWETRTLLSPGTSYLVKFFSLDTKYVEDGDSSNDAYVLGQTLLESTLHTSCSCNDGWQEGGDFATSGPFVSRPVECNETLSTVLPACLSFCQARLMSGCSPLLMLLLLMVAFSAVCLVGAISCF